VDDQLSPDELAYAYFSKPADHSPELTSQLTSELGSEFSLPSVEAHIDITEIHWQNSEPLMPMNANIVAKEFLTNPVRGSVRIHPSRQTSIFR